LNARSLRLELAPSLVLASAIVVLHAAAGFSILAVMPGAPGFLAAGLVLLLGLASAWSRALFRSASSARALKLIGASLEVELTGGAVFAAELAERRYVGRYIVLLPVRSPMRRTILVTRDMLDADSFRHLRIWALWGRLPRVAAKQLPA
jgi:hypothetical protein